MQKDADVEAPFLVFPNLFFFFFFLLFFFDGVRFIVLPNMLKKERERRTLGNHSGGSLYLLKSGFLGPEGIGVLWWLGVHDLKWGMEGGWVMT